MAMSHVKRASCLLRSGRQFCSNVQKLRVPFTQDVRDGIEKIKDQVEPDNLIEEEPKPVSQNLLDALDWNEIMHYAGTDVLDFCLNTPFIDPETKAEHYVLGLNPLSNSSISSVIHAIDQIRPFVVTFQAPRDTRISNLIEEQKGFINSKSTGLNYADEVRRIMRDTDVEDLREKQLITEFIESPLDEILKEYGVITNGDWVAASWAADMLNMHVVTTHLSLSSFLVWRNYFDKHGDPCDPPDSGAGTTIFQLLYGDQLKGLVEYENHDLFSKQLVNALMPPNLAHGVLSSQLNELLDPSLHLLQTTATSFYSATHMVQQGKDHPGKKILHLVQNNNIRDIMRALSTVEHLPLDFHRCMESNGSGPFWRYWKDMGGTQTSFVNLDLFKKPDKSLSPDE